MKKGTEGGVVLTLARESKAETRSDIVRGVFLSLLLFLAWGGCLYQLYLPSFHLELILVFGVLFVTALYCCWVFPKARIPLIAVMVTWLVIVVVAMWPTIYDGFSLTATHIGDVFGRSFARMYPHYEVGIPESDYADAVTAFLLPVCALLALLSVYVARRCNLVLSLLVTGFLLVSMVVLRLDMPVLVLCLLALAQALVFHGALRRRRNFSGKRRPIPWATFGLLLCSLAVVAGVVFLINPADGYRKDPTAQSVQRFVSSVVDGARYNKGANALPGGEFEGLGNLNLSDKAALEVTMEKPDSVWLRGFVGSDYDGHGFSDPDPEGLYENADLFYWLHRDSFFGQSQLAAVSGMLREWSPEDYTAVTVDNVGASSKYVYTPYETYWAEAEILEPTVIGDVRLSSPGLLGTRNYGYLTADNQVKSYPELSVLLYDKDSAGEEDVAEYLIDETNYRKFIYETFTDLPEDTRTLLSAHLGGDVDEVVDFADAKQKILEYLTEGIEYSEEIRPDTASGDFLQSFLEETRSGYSAHFATAATCMFRYYGIPARYVEGYLITPADVEGIPDNSTIYLDESHAHAWTEVYMDGIGWIPVEVTPPYFGLMEEADAVQGVSSGQSGGSGSDEESSEEMTEDNYEPLDDEMPDLLAQLWPWLLVLLLLLIIAALAAWIVHGRNKVKRRFASFEETDPTQAVLHLFKYDLEVLESLGVAYTGGSLYDLTYRMAPDSTGILQSVAHGDGQNVFAMQLRQAIDIYQQAAYSASGVSDEQRDVSHRFMLGLLEQAKARHKGLRSLYIRHIRHLY